MYAGVVKRELADRIALEAMSLGSSSLPARTNLKSGSRGVWFISATLEVVARWFESSLSDQFNLLKRNSRLVALSRRRERGQHPSGGPFC